MAWQRWHLIAGICLLVGTTTATALSLGRIRGTALIGRALDVAVQVSLDAQEVLPEANCFAADLYYGDSRVSASTINLSSEQTAGGESRLRIRSTMAVDEPVVTLYIRLSCGATTSRRYVLLSETLTDAEPRLSPELPISQALLPSSPSTLRSVTARAPAAAANTASPSAVLRTDRQAMSNEQRQARREARQRSAQERIQERTLARSQEATPVSQATAMLEKPRASVLRQSDQAKSGASRLQVDLLDLSSPDIQLRGSVELSSAPSGDEAVRRQAQALWRTLNASPEDALKDAQRLETLESQMRAAINQSKRQGQDIAALSSELQAAQKSRYLNPFTLFLGVLALAALALSLMLWRRGSSSSSSWWGSTAAKSSPQDEEHLWQHLREGSASTDPAPRTFKAKKINAASPASHTGSQSMPSVQQTAAPSDPAEITSPGVLAGGGAQGPLRFVDKPSAAVDFAAPSEKFSVSTAKITPLGTSAAAGRGGSMGRVDSTPPPSVMPISKSSESRRNFGNSDFAASGFTGPRVVAAEELFDIQEQADFFMSLNQPEQAIEVLKNHITDNVETSALAYMDLFDIYHRTGRENDYAQLREEFNRVFNAQVPEFANFGSTSMGLEDYPDVLSKIQKQWSKPLQALDLIEESIFRQPDQDRPPLDMQAYRELMLLYAMSKELVRPRGGYSMLPAATQSGAMPMIAPRDLVPTVPDFELEIDEIDASAQQQDMLSSNADIANSSSPELSLVPENPTEPDHGLDFDLSEMDLLDDMTFPGIKKKT